jgi:predicted ATPase
LALAAAATVADRFRGGVFFVDLTALGSGDQVPGAIADAMGLQGVGGVDEQVLEFLGARVALVILDNCEHLVDDVAEFVDRVLDLDGESKLLATSREDLDVDGERTLRVSSLAATEGARVGPAVELFIDRAEAAGVELFSGGDATGVLNEICERLDGIPLAIELAAAQLPHLSPSDLLDRLDERFDLLSGGRRRRRQRQQTLQAVMDWSWELLTETEQTLLARLAVFSGPWNLAGAEGICAERGGPPIITTLGALVHKKLGSTPRRHGGANPVPDARDGPALRPTATGRHRRSQ